MYVGAWQEYRIAQLLEQHRESTWADNVREGCLRCRSRRESAARLSLQPRPLVAQPLTIMAPSERTPGNGKGPRTQHRLESGRGSRTRTRGDSRRRGASSDVVRNHGHRPPKPNSPERRRLIADKVRLYSQPGAEYHAPLRTPEPTESFATTHSIPTPDATVRQVRTPQAERTAWAGEAGAIPLGRLLYGPPAAARRTAWDAVDPPTPSQLHPPAATTWQTAQTHTAQGWAPGQDSTETATPVPLPAKIVRKGAGVRALDPAALHQVEAADAAEWTRRSGEVVRSPAAVSPVSAASSTQDVGELLRWTEQLDHRRPVSPGIMRWRP
eukprot:Hpha_TRINITY_DN4448_c0_g1::TRINITY_DN4448_c0_g1_i1::g.50323::m.50323